MGDRKSMIGADHSYPSATDDQSQRGARARTPTNSDSPVPSGVGACRVLGVDELAVLFGCSTEKIKRQARKGELPAFKFGKSWYVREQDLRTFIDRAVETGADPRR
jgi:excisionase family DNA binding protein